MSCFITSSDCDIDHMTFTIQEDPVLVTPEDEKAKPSIAVIKVTKGFLIILMDKKFLF